MARDAGASRARRDRVNAAVMKVYGGFETLVEV